MHALLVYLIGPSGVGKDSLQQWLADHWQGSGTLKIARRCITRPLHSSGEAHEVISEADFFHARDGGLFALAWAAHGFYYGIRRQTIQDTSSNDVLLINGSRAYLPEALQRMPELAVLSISASPEVLHQRLHQRGRENHAEIATRTVRSSQLASSEALAKHPQVFHLNNDGDLAQAGQIAMTWLQGLQTCGHTKPTSSQHAVPHIITATTPSNHRHTAADPKR